MAAAASINRPTVESVETTMTLWRTFDVAAVSDLRRVGHHEPCRTRPLTDLPIFS